MCIERINIRNFEFQRAASRRKPNGNGQGIRAARHEYKCRHNETAIAKKVRRAFSFTLSRSIVCLKRPQSTTGQRNTISSLSFVCEKAADASQCSHHSCWRRWNRKQYAMPQPYSPSWGLCKEPRWPRPLKVGIFEKKRRAERKFCWKVNMRAQRPHWMELPLNNEHKLDVRAHKMLSNALIANNWPSVLCTAAHVHGMFFNWFPWMETTYREREGEAARDTKLLGRTTIS